MRDRATWLRRPHFYGALVIALVALVVPVSQSIAGASSNTATAPIEKNTYLYSYCGYPSGHSQIGKVKFTRTKDDSIIVDVTLYGADSTRDYYIYLYYNEYDKSFYYCSDYTYLGDVKVVNGHAHKVFEVTDVSELYNQFYISAYNNATGNYDESTYVSI